MKRKTRNTGKFHFKGRGPALWLMAALMAAPSSAALAGQTINIDSEVNHTVHGNGDPLNNGQGSAKDPSGNTVNINSGGKVTGTVYGGFYQIANSGTAKVEGNTVIVKDGQVTGSINGGIIWMERGADNCTLTSSGNAVIIDGGTIDGKIYGGTATVTGTGSVGTASDNTVTIMGASDLSSSVELYGGQVSPGQTSSGNTLNLKTAGLAVTGLVAFQKLNFYLPSAMKAGETFFTVAYADISDATVEVGVEGGGSALKVGDEITLIKSDYLDGTPVNTETSGTGLTGLTQEFSFDLWVDDNDLMAKVTSITGVGDNGRIDARLKNIAGSRVAGVGFLTQGADLMTRAGLENLKAATYGAGGGPAVFGALGGSSVRYNSGSHVDVDGFNLATGLGWNFPLQGGDGVFLLGAFFEAGWGGYDSHNSFAGAAIKGDGDTNYYGGGIMGRFDLAPTGPGHFYAEASFRGGRIETDYASGDIRLAGGGRARYDSSTGYYGAHAGLGYVWNLSEASSLDLYTKYLWTHQGGDAVTIGGDRLNFQSVDSRRWRTGAKLAHALESENGFRVTPYVGAAYEHEFDGQARGTVNRLAIDEPEIKGGTGVGELGFTFKPRHDSGLTVDLGLQGYAGKREGFGGSLQFKWAF